MYYSAVFRTHVSKTGEARHQWQ